MSARQGRHARGGDGWTAQPSRSAELAGAVEAETADPSRRAPGRKDRSRCKKSAGGPHVPVIVRDRYGVHGRECRWEPEWGRGLDGGPLWLCLHHEECSNCGKVLRLRLGVAECPDWHEITGAERAQVEAAIAAAAERRAKWARRTGKPVIAGPQGYRRRRDG